MNIKHTSCPLASGYKEKVAGHLLCSFGNFPLAPTLKAPLRRTGRLTGADFTLPNDVYRTVERTAGRGSFTPAEEHHSDSQRRDRKRQRADIWRINPTQRGLTPSKRRRFRNVGCWELQTPTASTPGYDSCVCDSLKILGLSNICSYIQNVFRAICSRPKPGSGGAPFRVPGSSSGCVFRRIQAAASPANASHAAPRPSGLATASVAGVHRLFGGVREKTQGTAEKVEGGARATVADATVSKYTRLSH